MLISHYSKQVNKAGDYGGYEIMQENFSAKWLIKAKQNGYFVALGEALLSH